MFACFEIVACSSEDNKKKDEPGQDQKQICEEGDVQCGTTGIPQKCVSGTWKDQEACETNKTCQNGRCTKKPEEPVRIPCEVGSPDRCSYSGVPQKCIEGYWTDQAVCSGAENCLNGKCITCREISKQCSDDGTPQECIDGKWVDKEKCSTEKTCIHGVCVTFDTSACLENFINCSENGVPQVCKNRKWEAQKPCDSEHKCVEGNCVLKNPPECGVSAKQCKSDSIPQVCQNGKWADSTPCKAGTKCLDGYCVEETFKECLSTETRCSPDGIPQLCINDKWQNTSACLENWKCVEGMCVPNFTPECSGEKKCTDNGLVKVCENGMWTDGPLCGENEKCLDGYCVPEYTAECLDGDTSCHNVGTLQVCVNGIWRYDYGYGLDCTESGSSCRHDKCRDRKNSGVCDDGDETCSGVKHRICSNGTWISDTCPENTRCVDNKCEPYSVPDCKNGDKRCTRSGIPEICVNQKWEKGALCDDLHICNEGNCVQRFYCEESECPKMPPSSYLGNICVEDVWYGESCGCNSDSDCQNGYKCNEITGYCSVKSAGSYTDEFQLTIPENGTCEEFERINDLSSCVQNGKNFELVFTNYAKVIISPSHYIQGGLVNLKEPGSDYYITFDNILPNNQISNTENYEAEFVWQHGSNSSNWAKSRIKFSNEEGPNKDIHTLEYQAYRQNEDMGGYYIPELKAFRIEGTGPNVVKIKSVKIKKSTDVNREYDYSVNGKHNDDWCKTFQFAGNVCIDTMCKDCGCHDDTECREGYKCNKNIQRCLKDEFFICDSKSDEDYLGSGASFDSCVCSALSDSLYEYYPPGDNPCREGFTCNELSSICYSLSAPKSYRIDFKQQPNTCEKLKTIPGVIKCEDGDNITLANQIRLDIRTKPEYWSESGLLLSMVKGSGLFLNRLDDNDTLEIVWHMETDMLDPCYGENISTMIGEFNDNLIVRGYLEKQFTTGANNFYKPITSKVKVKDLHTDIGKFMDLIISAQLSGIVTPHCENENAMSVKTYIDSLTITRE